ncbi:MAG: hypothetical protein AAB897_01295 [Patescibacteria group bacterium]
MNPAALYAKYLNGLVKLASPLRVVSDSSNGTTGIVLRRLKNKKLSLRLLNARPDGRFPAHGPNPWATGAMNELSKKIRAHRADFGAIFDADGDRAFFVDDKGRAVPQEALVLLFKEDFPPPYLIDVRMGWLVKKSGLRFIESRVGHYFMRKVMREKKLRLGVEFSGHTYFEYRFGVRRTYFDSGIRSMVHFANGVSRLKARGLKLSTWLDSLPRYFRSGEINFRVENKELAMKKLRSRFGRSARRVSHLDGLLMEFENWWFNVRASNTEPLLRLNVEAKEAKLLKQKTAELMRFIGRFGRKSAH